MLRFRQICKKNEVYVKEKNKESALELLSSRIVNILRGALGGVMLR